MPCMFSKFAIGKRVHWCSSRIKKWDVRDLYSTFPAVECYSQKRLVDYTGVIQIKVIVWFFFYNFF